jgi:hypothetical protein
MSAADERVVFINLATGDQVELVRRNGKLHLEGDDHERREKIAKLMALAYLAPGARLPPRVQCMVVGERPGPQSLVTNISFEHTSGTKTTTVRVQLEALSPPPRPVAP